MDGMLMVCFVTWICLIGFSGAIGCQQDNGEYDCGSSGQHNNRHKRVVNGNDAQLGTWPWQVSLQFLLENSDGNVDSYHYCGGSILDTRWIITAGHCAKQRGVSWGSMRIYAGITNIGSYYLWYYNETVDRPRDGLQNMNPHLQVFEAEKLIHYKDNSQTSTLDGEVLLIKLKTAIEFNEVISPVCLPSKSPDSYMEPGRMCWSTGFGVLQEGGRVGPESLQEVDLAIISRDTCEEWFRDLGLTNTHITGYMICTGYEHIGKTPCHGDSGGPLVYYQDGQWELIGLTSWGHHCGEPRNPAVFVFVAPFVDWICQTIRDN